MSFPLPSDHKSTLIDTLSEDGNAFRLSNLYFKNGNGIKATYEMERMESELLDFAKDPSLPKKQLQDVRPRQPIKSETMTDEEFAEAEADYRELMRQYEMAQRALKMEVPIEDYYAIQKYMRPFRVAMDATPAVKGRRFHAFTKDPSEENKGLFGMGKKQQG